MRLGRDWGADNLINPLPSFSPSCQLPCASLVGVSEASQTQWNPNSSYLLASSLYGEHSGKVYGISLSARLGVEHRNHDGDRGNLSLGKLESYWKRHTTHVGTPLLGHWLSHVAQGAEGSETKEANSVGDQGRLIPEFTELGLGQRRP